MKAYLIALPLLFAATPAFATSTITCRAGQLEVLRLNVGAGGVGQAVLTRGSALYATYTSPPTLTIGQAWLDRGELKVDLYDGNVDARMGELRTRSTDGELYVGTLAQDGRTIQVRCIADG